MKAKTDIEGSLEGAKLLFSLGLRLQLRMAGFWVGDIGGERPQGALSGHYRSAYRLQRAGKWPDGTSMPSNLVSEVR